ITISDKKYLEDEIWKDESWEIVGEPKSKLVKAGYKVPISDLVISDQEGVNHTTEIIENPDYNLIIVAYDMNKTNRSGFERLNNLAESMADDYRIRTVLLTASTPQTVEEVTAETDLYAEVFYSDAVPL